jgi:hypothetical protein
MGDPQGNYLKRSNRMAPNTSKALDFLGIGAAKSGTTTLFQYLRHHPQLYLPPEKEIPFFSDPLRLERGWQVFAQEYYADAPDTALWGKITPQYMSSPQIPERIHACMPNVRLIAILRNPIDRCLSYYRMMVRLNRESQPLVEVVARQLKPDHLATARNMAASLDERTETYLVRGEYGRLLARYLEFFPHDQLLILFTDDLERAPHELLIKVHTFLGVDATFVPPNLGKKYYEGGSRQKYPHLIPLVRHITPIKWLWRIIPTRQRKLISKWYKTQLNVVHDAPPPLSDDVYKQLVDFYLPDIRHLEKLIGRQVPWKEFAS